MNLRRLLAFLAGVSAFAASAQIAPRDPAVAALPPQFEVEIIVFANREFDPTEERFESSPHGLGTDPLAPLAPFAQEAPAFDATTFPSLTPTEPLAPAEPAPALPEDPLAQARAAAEEAMRIRPLSRSEWKLGGEYRRLQALSAYQPLLHAAWVQPGLPENEAKPLDLATLGALNPSGTVRVHLSRFLHITLDLTYQGASFARAAAAGDGLDELVLAPRYRLKTTRSARSGELHYFDHPAFGVLLRVTPVPASSAAPGTDRRPAA